ncbi:hypothetical protein, partial [Streptomyces sp. RK76]|uniref:hypothetical protein n=1 Tax=Streptomyces sp. RK76 TaxID=2824896 RepID=UPI001B5B628A|nr:hypothetical protein [Streptomyces sp. RK76]
GGGTAARGAGTSVPAAVSACGAAGIGRRRAVVSVGVCAGAPGRRDVAWAAPSPRGASLPTVGAASGKRAEGLGGGAESAARESPSRKRG